MNRLNSERLRRDYPELFDQWEKEGSPFAMFGFQCGDGWYGLIDRLSRDLVEICRKQGAPVPPVAQVKEKFGRLCFYLKGAAPDAVHERIHQAGEESTRTCEHCGKAGELKADGSGYWRTLCERCRKKEIA